MLAVWMVYATAVGLLVTAGVRLLETRWAAQGRARWVWVGGLMLALALPLVRPVLPDLFFSWFGGSSTESDVVRLGIPVVTQAFAADERLVTQLSTVLFRIWLAGTLVLCALTLAGILRLRRRLRAWRPRLVDGHRVLVSGATGPAVLGVFAPKIVIPSWVLDLPESQRRMILAHEAQHVEGGDAPLLAAGLAAAVLMPWNVGVWWAFGGLRHAVETDCDHRVLTSGVGQRTAYARLLLDVGTRPSAPMPLGAGFGERTSSLERRIRTMLKRRDAVRGGGAVRLAGALALLLAACAVEGPDASLPTDLPDETVLPDPVVPEAEFTPFTVAPAIANRGEIVAALESEYPPLLRDAGIGGTAKVYLFILENGQVQDLRIDESSGHQALDDAALRVGARFRFSPALDGDKAVPVWVSIPITFTVR